ncbi:hypothetical protein BC628DRAFT_1409571 [Trametes gibbosa]|nr:hypothetical protein BC628DRAFT_1409571 [Trametes gibbosa]
MHSLIKTQTPPAPRDRAVSRSTEHPLGQRPSAFARPAQTGDGGRTRTVTWGCVESFCQLPPPGRASSLYSSFVGKWSSTSAPSAQKNTLGKVLWHQFTTVVILRENMRQRGLCHEDVLFHIALENMRYGRCTATDIALLRTRIAMDCPAGPSLSDPWFRQISIITACNAYRDTINARRTCEFAANCGVLLHSFFSYDCWGKAVNSDSARQAQRLYEKTMDPVRADDSISSKLQEILWQVPPCMSDHHAGILMLCIGMPVLLKFNEATELCATNGAEAKVVKMVAGKTLCGRPCLESLHVRLTSPPRNVQVPGLPMNVIPLGRSKQTVDTVVAIAREQVMILPNFAMTDYACQGRTRPDNVVHLKFWKNHQAMYTCFSRSSSLSGTLILGDFDMAKIQSGFTWHLKASAMYLLRFTRS